LTASGSREAEQLSFASQCNGHCTQVRSPAATCASSDPELSHARAFIRSSNLRRVQARSSARTSASSDPERKTGAISTAIEARASAIRWRSRRWCLRPTRARTQTIKNPGSRNLQTSLHLMGIQPLRARIGLGRTPRLPDSCYVDGLHTYLCKELHVCNVVCM